MAGYTLLNGVRVLEVAQLAPSSVGGHLADLGAEVIKIEEPGRGDGVRYGGALAVGDENGPGFLHLRWNRGKKSVALDLRSPRGQRVFLDLVASSDVVIEGTRAGYFERLGVSFDTLVAANPSIVFCAVSGTGQDGPYRSLGSGGLWFDAYAGLRTVDGSQASPEHVMGGSAEPPIAMYALGAYAAMGILAGLHRARATGEPARLEIASVDIAAAWMPDRIDAALNSGVTVARPGWTPDGRLAHWPRLDAYETSDGGTIILQVHLDKFWRRLCTAIGRPDLLDIDLEHADEDHPRRAAYVRSELADAFRQRSKAEWVELFLSLDIAGGPANGVQELLADPHFTARETTYRVVGVNGEPLELAALPVRVHGQQFSPSLAPELGADTGAVLGAPAAGVTASPLER
jgi:crotonobetainyl-CoA:carnitine CoA-transferase CaiB-like acyl-CoA transferase